VAGEGIWGPRPRARAGKGGGERLQGSHCFRHPAYNYVCKNNAKRKNDGNTIASLIEHALYYKSSSSYSKTSVSVRPHVNEKPAFSKLFTQPLQSVFEKDAFSVNVFTEYMWTVDQTGGKKYPFSTTKKDTWGRGIN